MTNKTFWMGFVAVFVVLQAIGFVIHGIWLQETYEALAAAFRPKAEMDSMMWIMMCSGTVVMFVFCYMFAVGREGTGIMEGVRFGALVGVLVGLPTSVDAYVIYPITSELAVIWFVTTAVSFMIGGAIFSVIYKPGG